MRDQRGFAAVLVILLIPAFLAMLGVAVDGAMLAHMKLSLDGSTVAAALAATDAYDRAVWQMYRRVLLSPEETDTMARQYLTLNMPNAVVDRVRIDPTSPNRVTVESHYDVRLAFMPIFGIRTHTVTASATASKS